ncbi:unnamed protein product [Prorocentrum cordatum]|uniref:Uncharacterized protein n=1 Tax=Prorocentrum cordatum TaxID=2364126 RepID=A0ABN9YC87_9DINO|nr:unnamed protein product [Polarella glacialis]
MHSGLVILHLGAIGHAAQRGSHILLDFSRSAMPRGGRSAATRAPRNGATCSIAASDHDSRNTPVQKYRARCKEGDLRHVAAHHDPRVYPPETISAAALTRPAIHTLPGDVHVHGWLRSQGDSPFPAQPRANLDATRAALRDLGLTCPEDPRRAGATPAQDGVGPDANFSGSAFQSLGPVSMQFREESISVPDARPPKAPSANAMAAAPAARAARCPSRGCGARAAHSLANAGLARSGPAAAPRHAAPPAAPAPAAPRQLRSASSSRSARRRGAAQDGGERRPVSARCDSASTRYTGTTRTSPEHEGTGAPSTARTTPEVRRSSELVRALRSPCPDPWPAGGTWPRPARPASGPAGGRRTCLDAASVALALRRRPPALELDGQKQDDEGCCAGAALAGPWQPCGAGPACTAAPAAQAPAAAAGRGSARPAHRRAAPAASAGGRARRPSDGFAPLELLGPPSPGGASGCPAAGRRGSLGEASSCSAAGRLRSSIGSNSLLSEASPSGASRRSKWSRRRSLFLEDLEVLDLAGRRMGRAQVITHQVKALAQELRRSMLTSFEQGVWEACDVPHPVAEKRRKEEQRIRDQTEALRKIAKSLTQNLKGWDSDKICTSVGINGDVDALWTERALMNMASDGKLTLLDVEEIQELFDKSCPSGHMNVHQDSSIFSRMCRELYVNASTHDMTQIYHILQKVRSRRNESEGGCSRRDIGSQGIYNEDAKVFILSDFVIAFGKWLSRQKTMDKMLRCSLTTFKLTAVERFRRDLKAASMETTKELVDEVCKQLSRRRSFLAANNLHSEELLGLHLDMSDMRASRSDSGSEDSSSDSGSSWGSQPESPSTSAAQNRKCYQDFRQIWKVTKANVEDMPTLQENEEEEAEEERASPAQAEPAPPEPRAASRQPLAEAYRVGFRRARFDRHRRAHQQAQSAAAPRRDGAGGDGGPSGGREAEAAAQRRGAEEERAGEPEEGGGLGSGSEPSTPRGGEGSSLLLWYQKRLRSLFSVPCFSSSAARVELRVNTLLVACCVSGRLRRDAGTTASGDPLQLANWEA